jgi:predicted nucleic acid-binding protein
MRFWDASAIVPLLVREPSSQRLRSLAAKDTAMLVWWGSEVECVSALARRERERMIDGRVMETALRRLRQFADGWFEVDPNDAVRETAERFLRVHPLRAADALQLAAAFAASERRPSSLEIVTLDDRLADVARREGFVVLEPTAE